MSKQPADPDYSRFTTELLAFASAMTFLTRLPLPPFPYRPELLGKSVTYFPLVGVLVALAGAAIYHLALLLWVPLIACTLSLLCLLDRVPLASMFDYQISHGEVITRI